MSNSLLYSCINLDVENTNRAFENVLSWMDDLNMEDEAERFADDFASVLAAHNPFLLYENGKVYTSPENKMISLIYEEASKKILEKYPNATTICKVDGYNSSFRVDDETYNMAYKARKEGE